MSFDLNIINPAISYPETTSAKDGCCKIGNNGMAKVAPWHRRRQQLEEDGVNVKILSIKHIFLVCGQCKLMKSQSNDKFFTTIHFQSLVKQIAAAMNFVK